VSLASAFISRRTMVNTNFIRSENYVHLLFCPTLITKTGMLTHFSRSPKYGISQNCIQWWVALFCADRHDKATAPFCLERSLKLVLRTANWWNWNWKLICSWIQLQNLSSPILKTYVFNQQVKLYMCMPFGHVNRSRRVIWLILTLTFYGTTCLSSSPSTIHPSTHWKGDCVNLRTSPVGTEPWIALPTAQSLY
jgi:hypothetical protein